MIKSHNGDEPFDMSPRDVARHANVAEKTVYLQLASGKLPGKKIHGRWRVQWTVAEALRQKMRILSGEEFQILIDRDADKDAPPVVKATDPPTSAESSDVDRRTNTELDRMREDKPHLFKGLSDTDLDELYSQHAAGGQLAEAGVKKEIVEIKSKNNVRMQVDVILESNPEHVKLLAKFVAELFAKAGQQSV